MFVPMATPSQASAAAMELGQRLVNVIEEYRRQHPGMTDEDIRLALRIASQHSAGASQRIRMLTILTIGLLVAGLLAFLMIAQR